MNYPTVMFLSARSNYKENVVEHATWECLSVYSNIHKELISNLDGILHKPFIFSHHLTELVIWLLLVFRYQGFFM